MIKIEIPLSIKCIKHRQASVCIQASVLLFFLSSFFLFFFFFGGGDVNTHVCHRERRGAGKEIVKGVMTFTM